MPSSLIESILFVSNSPISLRELSKSANRAKDEIEVILESLKNKYNNEDSGIHIIEHDNKIQMVINPDNTSLVAEIIKEDVTSELTRPQLETLTVIAYRGPITKLELEQIRGVNCSLIIRNLLIKNLIEVKNDKIIDNSTYSISMEFMKHLGINNIEELPNYSELSKTEELNEAIEN